MAKLSSSTLLAGSRPKELVLDLVYQPTVYKFVLAAATGMTEEGRIAREIACFGTRGDGKTQGAFGAMVSHATRHAQAGFPLPCKWLGVTDSFAAHKNKTHESLHNPMWKGLWTLRDGGHVAVFGAPGNELVNLHLFGIEDVGALDRVRTECVGVWFEEPAPAAVLVQSSGVSLDSWLMATTSQRIPSHCHPAIISLNYPDEDHWTWERFVTNPHENTCYFRVPPGELASAAARSEWMKALAGRPDLQRRLLQGQPGVVMLGAQVALGFDEDKHVSTEPIKLLRNEPLLFGQDGGLTPTTLIGQALNGRLLIAAALTIDRGGMRQLYEQKVVPWLLANAPWALRNAGLIKGIYDPSMPDDESDSDRNPIKVIEEMIGGLWLPGPITWEARKGALITALNMPLDARPALQMDRVGCKQLIQALTGRWYYPKNRLGGVSKDSPAKPNHPWEDLGDALCYWICAALPELQRLNVRRHLGEHGLLADYDPYADANFRS